MDNDVPRCDYKIVDYSFNRNFNSNKNCRLRFKNSVRRAMVLNKVKEIKTFKIIELINFIKTEKAKQASSNLMP